MIITSREKLENGKIYDYEVLKVPFHYHGNFFWNYKFQVIRETTKEEYLKELEENGLYHNKNTFRYFYQISMD